MIRKVVPAVALLLACMAALAAPAAQADPSQDQAAMLAALPSNVKVAYVGVHEAASAGSMDGQGRKGSVRVNVGPDTRPIVLVLSNQEPVDWVVSAGERTISAILLAGSPTSTVKGHGSAPLIRVSHLAAHKAQSVEYLRLRREVGRYVRSGNQTFLGSYKGVEFSVR